MITCYRVKVKNTIPTCSKSIKKIVKMFVLFCFFCVNFANHPHPPNDLVSYFQLFCTLSICLKMQSHLAEKKGVINFECVQHLLVRKHEQLNVWILYVQNPAKQTCNTKIKI